MSQLFATKPVDRLLAEAREAGDGTLTRALGPMNLIALGIGAVIGAGIFVITGSAAAQFAGPAIVLSFLLAGLGCAFAGLCYAELASMIPIAVSTAAQEAKNPQRDMPIGILGSLAICTVLYVIVAALLTLIIHYSQLNVAAPVAVGIDVAGVRWGSLLVKGGSIAGLSTVMLVTLMGQSRIFYTMSKDGLLPKWASTIHPRFKTPWISTIVVGIAVAIFAGLIPISVLGQLVSIGTLFAFIIVCAAVLILRSRRPDLPRAFRTPWSPAVPIAGILISLYLMMSLPLDTWLRLGVWLAIGIVIYFAYSRRHSVVGKALEAQGRC